jgi:hypothetical protein
LTSSPAHVRPAGPAGPMGPWQRWRGISYSQGVGTKPEFRNHQISRSTILIGGAGLTPLIRLNGTSDIVYENLIVDDNKNIFQFVSQCAIL